MDYIFAAFASATVAKRACDFLERNAIQSSVILIPQQVGLGCGKGVRFDQSDFNRVRTLLGYSHPSFRGFFLVTLSPSGKRLITKL